MCKIPHFTVYEHIAESADAPQEVRDAAEQQLKQLASLQTNVNKVADTVSLPSGGNAEFLCSIYSMNNKDFEEHIRQEHGKAAVISPDTIMKLPGILLRESASYSPDDEDETISDPCLDLTYDGFLSVHTFYKTVFNRNSIDDNGLELRGTIHLSQGYSNAFWDPDHRAMFFGDGGRKDGRGWLVLPANNPESSHLTNWHAPYALEILGHELTHGVVACTAGLGNGQQELGNRAALVEAWTLDEHIADCFGIMIKQFSINNVDPKSVDCPWEIAPEWFSSTAKSIMGWTKGYLRTFQPIDPAGLKQQPDQGSKHMKDFIPFVNPTTHRMGDPHINVGILNRAFYAAAIALAAEGPTWKTVGTIWYSALTDKTFISVDNQTFKGWAALTNLWAEKLFGGKGKTIMTTAWNEVGL